MCSNSVLVVCQDLYYSVTTLENILKIFEDLKLCQLDQNVAHILVTKAADFINYEIMNCVVNSIVHMYIITN